MTENLRQSVEGRITGTDDVSLLRLIRNQVRATHAEAAELSNKTYATEEEATAAIREIVDDFAQSYDTRVANAVEATVRVSGTGVKVPNIALGNFEDGDTFGINVTGNSEEPLKQIDMFETREGRIKGIYADNIEVDDGFRPVVALIIEELHKKPYDINFPNTKVPMFRGYFVTQFFAELNEDTLIEHPAIEELERYENAVSALAKKSVIKKRFFDQIHRIKAAFYAEEAHRYQELKALPELRWVVRRCEELIQKQEGQDTPVCTDEEVAELLSTFVHRDKTINLKGPVTDGDSIEQEGKVVDVFVQRNEDDIPTICLALEAKGEDNPSVTSFIMRDLELMEF